MSNSTPKKAEKKDLTVQVLNKVNAFQNSGELRIPENYSPENALKSAYLILEETTNKQGQKALEHCTPQSIAESLLKMVVWGLSPLKKQCDFIMYGNKLQFSPEYTGNIVLAKRYGGLKDIKAQVVFEGDEFDFEINPKTGRTEILFHKPSLQSMGSKNISAVYAVMQMKDGSSDAEIMPFKMVQDAWNQGATKGQSPAHKNFPDQMAKKTVINRACKLLIRGSDDAVLYSDKEETEEYIDIPVEDVKQEVEEKGNKKPLTINEEKFVEPEQPKETPKSKQQQDEEYQKLLDEEIEKSRKQGPNF